MEVLRERELREALEKQLNEEQANILVLDNILQWKVSLNLEDTKGYKNFSYLLKALG